MSVRVIPRVHFGTHPFGNANTNPGKHRVQDELDALPHTVQYKEQLSGFAEPMGQKEPLGQIMGEPTRAYS